MKKELKNRIKQDDFVTGMEWAASWIGAHRGEVRVTAIVIAIVAAGAAGLAYFQSNRTRQAEAAFAQALETFKAPVASELPEGIEKPAGPIYPSAAEKYKKAVAAFDGIERKFGNHVVAVRARYYGALCRIELGDVQEAQKTLTEMAAKREEKGLEPTLARMALADLYRRGGQLDKAVESYRQLADDAALPLPRDHALFSLARTLEEAHRLGEARDSYRRVSDEFPSSVYAAEARKRATFLETAGQG